MTPERFSQQFSPENKEDCSIPERMPTGRDPLTFKQYPGESSSLEMLYFSKEIIDTLKSRVDPFIPKGSFVSTADLMQALFWMVGWEVNTECGEVTNSTDLGIAGASSVYMVELYMNGLGIIPPNYLGNGIVLPVVQAGSEMGNKSLIELLASLALQTRQKQIELKEEPKEVFKLLVKTCTLNTSNPGPYLAVVTNACKMQISEADFGRGAPALFFRLVLFPIVGSGWFINPVFQTEGILAAVSTTTKQKERLRKSSVLKECAPGVKSLFDDFEVSQLDNLLKTKQC